MDFDMKQLKEGGVRPEGPVRADVGEFQDTGLVLFVNEFLHIFGWTLVVEIDDYGGKTLYPAKTKFRGFPEGSVSRAYDKLGAYISSHIDEIGGAGK